MSVVKYFVSNYGNLLKRNYYQKSNITFDPLVLSPYTLVIVLTEPLPIFTLSLRLYIEQ